MVRFWVAEYEGFGWTYGSIKSEVSFELLRTIKYSDMGIKMRRGLKLNGFSNPTNFKKVSYVVKN